MTPKEKAKKESSLITSHTLNMEQNLLSKLILFVALCGIIELLNSAN